ncbi:zinc finger TRAF-type-containing protein 1 [Malurus melanocephalus]|uniref:zinc finger TRAF-type-containing protein 1 n=1 Tax=Malurus melanocephalus TaxID=175006 RepID=UPI002548C148|nr:zinc finger TRAF-type-containing protein 1 [Malurus melanocephalus]
MVYMVTELPAECGFCARQFPRSLLERHQNEQCQDTVTQCKYKRIGCPWQGPFHELSVHEAECTHPTKTGNELMDILDEMDQTRKKEMQLYNSIFSLLSFEKIGYTGRGRHPKFTEFNPKKSRKKSLKKSPQKSRKYSQKIPRIPHNAALQQHLQPAQLRENRIYR